MTGPAASPGGKTALVTGAATGIGKAIAAELATAGARVVINHPHTPELAAKVVADIDTDGGTALAIAADVSSKEEYRAMVDRLLAQYGRWDILVNNAAVAITKPFPQITGADFDRSFAVNVKGVFHGAFSRLGRPAEIAAVVAFLATDAAGWVTAQNIRANGGTV
ncbi:MAG TPA: SDR family oxidoreductase [Streptosporangiaceae bacterium]|nr:SDR family oxidoreductase [Streptosporangiaceae bacterium]